MRSDAGGKAAVVGSISRLVDVDRLQESWVELQKRANGSFFASWAWIGPWINSLDERADTYIYEAHVGNRLVALGTLCLDKTFKRKIVPSHLFSLNERKEGAHNLWIEYNGLLMEEGIEDICWQDFFRTLLKSEIKWDELALSGVGPKVQDIFLAGKYPLHLVVDQVMPPWRMELISADADLDVLLKKFSSNTRYQIRRSFKEYQADGDIELHAAQALEQALEYFEMMGRIHTERWNRIGEAGSFASAYWVDFHRALITTSFKDGVVQMLRVSCNNRDLGYIYNYVWNGVVYVLQNGFVVEDDNKRKPGFIAHCLAIAYNAGNGAAVYDFMVGESQYKRSLAQAGEALLWLRIQKPRVRFKLLALVETVYRYFRDKIYAKCLRGFGLKRNAVEESGS